MTDVAIEDTPVEPDEPARSSERAVRRVLGLAVVLGALAVWLTVSSSLLRSPARPGPWWLFVLIAVGYAVAEHSVFHVEYRREALTFSMSEVPTAFALVFLDPVTAIIARLAGSLAVIVRGRRTAGFKVVFNAALFAFEVALAFAIFAGIAGPGFNADGALLLGLAAAIALSTHIGSLMVSVAISCFEGDLIARVIEEARTRAVIGSIAASIAAVAVAPALISLELVVLAGVPIAAVWWVLLKHGRLSQRHRDLEDLHDFASSVSSSLRIDEIATVALDSALDLVRSERGALVIFGPDGVVQVTRHVGAPQLEVPANMYDSAWRFVVASEGAVGYHERNGVMSVLQSREPAEQIAVPVRDRGGLLGLLLMSDRSGVADRFDHHELRRAGRLGDQLATHLRNAALHADIEHTALHDGLTGDRNRRAFDEIVTAELLERAETSPTEVAAVVMLDLDRFKEVNDTFGHHTGDLLLIEFARRVRELLDPDDVFARFGGDEFAVFVRRPDRSAVSDLADRIVTRSHEALPLGGYDIVVAVSAGIAMVSTDDRDSASVLRRADIAMYAAKSSHAGYEVYRAEIDRRTPERLAILGDLRDAIDGDGLEVHYQPKIDIDRSTVVGAEALIRWHHPTRGWIKPDDFIPVAEESGLIRQLTDRVLALAIEAVAEWRSAGFDLGVAVNLSALDLVDEELPSRIAFHLERHELDVDALTLEITESSLMADTPRTMATIERLSELGVRLSLDDFGTGYSSLSYLRQLPVSELKIDRSFVSNVLLDAQDEVIVRSTVDLGHNLGLSVVAEGIESEQMLEHLRGLGCDLGQGYSISRPLESDLFERWLTMTEHEVPRLARRGGLQAVPDQSVSRSA